MKHRFTVGPDSFLELKDSLARKYPTLHVLVEDGTVYVRGTLVLDTEDGKELDRYHIEIELPPESSTAMPAVREVGGRLPKTPERHFNDSETACLCIPDELYKFWPPDSGIIDFIEGPVKNFFLWQTDYDLNKGKSSFGERSHGAEGILEFYKEELGTQENSVVKTFLEYLSRREVKGHWPCYCGSGKRMRLCHFHKLLELRSEIPQKVAGESFERVFSQSRKKPSPTQ